MSASMLLGANRAPRVNDHFELRRRFSKNRPLRLEIPDESAQFTTDVRRIAPFVPKASVERIQTMVLRPPPFRSCIKFERAYHEDDNGGVPVPVEMSGRNFRFGSTLDHSMISSARARTDGGIVKPRALAVLRLMIRRTWVASSTGRSRGV